MPHDQTSVHNSDEKITHEKNNPTSGISSRSSSRLRSSKHESQKEESELQTEETKPPPAAKPKPDEIKDKCVVPCTKYRMEAMKHIALGGVLPDPNRQRQEAMDYLAGDVIASARKIKKHEKDADSIIFHPGVRETRRQLIPDDRLTDMKNIVNRIAHGTKVEDESSSNEMVAMHTQEVAYTISGNFDYAGVLLDDILKELDDFDQLDIAESPPVSRKKKSSLKKNAIVFSEERAKGDRVSDISDIQDPKTSQHRSRSDIGDVSSKHKSTPDKIPKVRFKEATTTVGTQTIHPELMELILQILSRSDKWQKSLKSCNEEKTRQRTDSTNSGEAYIIKHSIATQTGCRSEKHKADVGYWLHERACDIDAPKTEMVRDVLESLKNISSNSGELRVKRSQSEMRLGSKVKTELTIKDKNLKSKMKTQHVHMRKMGNKADACTQVRERKRLVIKTNNSSLPSTSRHRSPTAMDVSRISERSRVAKRQSILSRRASKSDTDLNKQDNLYMTYKRMSDDEKLKYKNRGKLKDKRSSLGSDGKPILEFNSESSQSRR